MKHLLNKTINGISYNEIPKNKKEKIDYLISKNMILKKRNMIFFNDDYLVGILDISKNLTGYLTHLDKEKFKKDILIEKNDLNNAKIGALVIAKKNKNSRKLKAKVIEVVQYKNEFLIAYIKKVGKNIVLYDFSTSEIIHTKTSQKELFLLPKDCILKINIQTSQIVEVLGVISDPFIDEKIVLYASDRSEVFDFDCTKEAKSFGKFVDKSMYTNRQDLTHLPFCTIDPSDAKDHDDAIYLDKENNTIYVAIADVSEYVNEFCFIDKEAQKRGFSIYFPHKSIPMLPRELSENLCSLKEGQDRLAFVCKIQLNSEYEVISEDFFEAIIKVEKFYSYEQIDDILENKIKQNNKINDYLFSLYDITKIIRKIRLRNSLEFTSSEIKIILDDNMKLVDTKLSYESDSHKIVEECMLLANKASAKIINDIGIFRVHENPNDNKIHTLLENLYSLGIDVNYEENIYKLFENIRNITKDTDISSFIDTMLIQTQQRAKYHHLCQGHFGLGFVKYSHFTSPIRRYSDLILHRLIKAKIAQDNKRYNYLTKDIQLNCIDISDKERETSKIQMNFDDRKFARFFHENQDIEVTGIVVDTNMSPILKTTKPIHSARIFLDTYPFDIKLFQELKVRIKKVDLYNNRIYADFIE
jgi:ribonuclease R